MENRKYKVKRDGVHIGGVIKTSTIYRYSNDSKYNKETDDHLGVVSFHDCRSMLFVLDENNLANDLLYNSPNYPVLNMSDDDMCLKLGDDAVVLKEAISLAPLLQYYGYPEELNYDDILKIRKRFFDGDFARENSILFGYKPVRAKDLYWHKHGEIVRNPFIIKQLCLKYEWEHRGDNRRYHTIDDVKIPREYFNVLDEYGDISLVQAFLCRRSSDVFVPDKKEGKVKKLSRF